MKITVVAPQPVPDAYGGAERATAGLVDHIDATTDHRAELVRLPSPESTLPEVMASYRAFAELDVSDADVVVSCKYPAWMVSHPDHRLLMLHPLRGLYDTYHLFHRPYVVTHPEPAIARLLDLTADPGTRDQLEDLWAAWDTAHSVLGEDHPAFAFPGPLARRLVHWLDQLALSPAEVSRHLTLSSTVAGRPGYLPHGVSPLVAHLPSDLPTVARHRPTHLVTASRLDGPKRIDLLIRAMRSSDVDVPLLIAGTGPAEEHLRAIAGDDDRIRFCGFVPDDELAELYATAIAVPFVPLDEDWGLITVEAFNAGTPVITCVDSGGPTELVADGISGWVVEPTPEALREAIEDAVARPDRTTEMGARGRTRARLVTWDRVVRRLLADPDQRATPPTPSTPATAPAAVSKGARDRPRIVVATTFTLEPALGGGQIRARHLYEALTPIADVEVVALAPYGVRTERRMLGPNLVETVVARTAEHHRRESEVSIRLGVPVGDVMIGSLLDRAPAYVAALREAAREATAVVLAEPYQLPAVRRAGIEVPLVYDAYNVEADLKASAYPPTSEGRALLDRVAEVEADAVSAAELVVACSQRDADELIRRYGRPGQQALVIGNGVDLSATPFVAPEPRRRASRRWRERYGVHDPDAVQQGGVVPDALGLFVGSHHPPNVDAAELLLDLAADRPELLVVLLGSHVDALVGHRLPANVAPVGVVGHPIKARLLASADVAFNPMRTGSGTNLKILEYLAVGVPVLSTPFGARGIDLDERHLVLADPGEWPRALDGLLGDPDAAAARARAGRALVEERYDWRALGRDLAAAVAERVGLDAGALSREAPPPRRPG